MSLNLDILSLDIVENLVRQKCLLPKSKFPSDLRPGAWAKCILRGNEFIICQIFSRDLPGGHDYCYMDESVASTKISEDNILEELVALQETKTVKEVDLAIDITDQFFATDLKKISRKYLRQVVEPVLQALKFIKGCSVRLPELAKLGIHAVHIKSAKQCDIDTMFSITDDVVCNINDVHLISVVSTTTFYPFGFEDAYRNLKDLLQVANFKKNKDVSFNLLLNAVLVGPIGCGKSSLVANFIQKNNCNCFRIATSNLFGQYPGETEAELRRIFQKARVFVKIFNPTSPTIILIEDFHLLCPTVKLSSIESSNSMRICAQLLTLVDNLNRSGLCIICLATTSSLDSINLLARRAGRFEHEIFINMPNAFTRRELFLALFQDCFKNQNSQITLTSELLDLVAKHTQGYVVSDLALLVRTIGYALMGKNSPNLTDIIKDALKKSKPIAISGTEVSVSRPSVNFDNIGGMVNLKRIFEVSLVLGLIDDEPLKRIGLNLPKGVLLYGPPGCGKTMVAKCLAGETNVSFIATSGAEVYSPFVGCAEKFIARIFDTARKNAPCIIFLDEIDSLVGRRALLSNGASSDVQLRILATLLTEMDGIIGSRTTNSEKHIIVVAATNRPDLVDDAVLRPGRIDKLIHVPPPDIESRYAILELHSQRMPFASDVNLIKIAEHTDNYSVADMCNICNEAAIACIERNLDADEITPQDFELVLKGYKSSLTQRQIDSYYDFENNR